MKMRLAALILAVLSLWPATQTSAETKPIYVSRLIARSAGRRIQIDKYTSPENAKGQAILVLHGAGGTVFDGPEMRRVALRLATDGNAVYLVHYFNRTGTLFGLDAGMQRYFEVWLETVRDCIKFVQKERGDGKPVGIYGYSLGGFLALAAASNNPSVGAVVEHAGGVWNSQEQRIQRMPPVLMVHGEEDRRVSFEKYAQPLARLLVARGSHVETRFFPGETHVFRTSAMWKVREAAAAFFRERLH
jgi:dienelactone hydrolase